MLKEKKNPDPESTLPFSQEHPELADRLPTARDPSSVVTSSTTSESQEFTSYTKSTIKTKRDSEGIKEKKQLKKMGNESTEKDEEKKDERAESTKEEKEETAATTKEKKDETAASKEEDPEAPTDETISEKAADFGKGRKNGFENDGRRKERKERKNPRPVYPAQKSLIMSAPMGEKKPFVRSVMLVL